MQIKRQTSKQFFKEVKDTLGKDYKIEQLVFLKHIIDKME